MTRIVSASLPRPEQETARAPWPVGAKVVVAGILLFFLGPVLVRPLPFGFWTVAFLSLAMYAGAILLIVTGAVMWSQGSTGGRLVSWWQTTFRPPPRRWVQAYLWVLGGALVAVALLFVVNVFVPLGADFLASVGSTVWRLIVGWGWGLLGLLLMGWRPLRWAGAVGLGVGCSMVVFGSLAAWDLTAYDLGRLWQGPLLLQLYLALGVTGWMALSRGAGVAAWAVVACTAAAGLLVGLDEVLAGTAAALDGRVARSAAPAGFAMAVSGSFLLLPVRPSMAITRWMWFAAPTVLAVCALVSPWLDGGAGAWEALTSTRGRLWLAGWVVAVVTAILGGTSWLLWVLRHGTHHVTPRPRSTAAAPVPGEGTPRS